MMCIDIGDIFPAARVEGPVEQKLNEEKATFNISETSPPTSE